MSESNLPPVSHTIPRPAVSATGSGAGTVGAPATFAAAPGLDTSTPANEAPQKSTDPAQLVKDFLAGEISSLTKQTRESVVAFLETYTPIIMGLAPLAAAGNKTAERNLKHLRIQAVMDAASYGVKLQQRSEAALQNIITSAVAMAIKALA